jgi:hypothetical protein
MPSGSSTSRVAALRERGSGEVGDELSEHRAAAVAGRELATGAGAAGQRPAPGVELADSSAQKAVCAEMACPPASEWSLPFSQVNRTE